jgi:L-ascorbate metabolism protein UlaG (beta-lactamase superfamily)
MMRKPFRNLTKTRQFAEGVTIFDVVRASMRRPKDLRPPNTLPSVKTDLKSFYSESPAVIWFGHSSYLIHADGLNFLIDPVFSGNASPFSFMIKAFGGSDVYKTTDMPPIDCLILTHNHYDHLDRKALKTLAVSIERMIIPVGVSLDLKGITFDRKKLTEVNWWDTVHLENEITLTSTPARHFSGRGLIRNRSLWTSYVLKLREHSIFIGGDSGYESHFREIGKRFGPFDLALLECGQYNKMWPYIHSTPEEAVTEAIELGARVAMPVHWGKFALSNHSWNEPVKRFVAEAKKQAIQYTTPKIGEPVVLGKRHPKTEWWNT